MKRIHDENTKFTIQPLGFENRVDEAVRKALLDLNKIPTIFSNQPIILAYHLDEGISTNIAYWPLTMDIGRRVVETLENYENCNSDRIAKNLLMLAIKEDSIEFQRSLLAHFQLSHITSLGQVMCIDDGQPQEECFRKESDHLPEVSLDLLNSHLYIIKCYAS